MNNQNNLILNESTVDLANELLNNSLNPSNENSYRRNMLRNTNNNNNVPLNEPNVAMNNMMSAQNMLTRNNMGYENNTNIVFPNNNTSTLANNSGNLNDMSVGINMLDRQGNTDRLAKNVANNNAAMMANNNAAMMANNNANNIAMNNDEGLSVDVSNNRGFVNNDYPVDVRSEVHPYLRSEDSVSSVPAPMVNGGLYCGPQNDAPWMPKYVPPTTTYFMQELVKHADPAPPPGIAEQYPGENRLGNNYTTMPGVNWYNSAYPRNNGPFSIKVIDDKWSQTPEKTADSLYEPTVSNNAANNNFLNSFDLTRY